jgi:hypothetical protein
VAEGERALVPLPAGGARLRPVDMVGRATRPALGAAGLALTVLEVVLERSGPADPGVRAPAAGAPTPPGPPGALRLLPAAALGLGLEAQRRALDAMAGARLPPPLRAAARPPVAVARAPLVAVWRRLDLDGWAARGLAEQRRNRQVAAATARGLVGAITAAVLDQVDVDAVVARVDLDRIADRIDLDRIVARIDLDAIAARIDVDAVVARVDLAGLTEQVMEEVDFGEIIRESSGTMATETVDALRVQGMRADRLLSRVVDRVLQRKDERDTAGP